MPILPKLISLYERRGFTISTGLNPVHFDNLELAPFTWLIRDGESVTEGLGIAAYELYFLETLLAEVRPKRIFIIGNSFGWSTLAMALMCPDAKVVAIDSGHDSHSLEGIALTNRIAEEEGLNAVVVCAASPKDVSTVVQDHLGGEIDLSFVDGLHTNEQIVLDFQAVQRCGAADAVHLFHDVQSFSLFDGFSKLREQWPGRSRILLGTTSGMGALYPENRADAWEPVFDAFSASQAALNVLDKELAGRRGKRKRKFLRSLNKRKVSLMRLFTRKA